MNRLDSMNDNEFVFASVLIVSNRMDTLLERELKEYDVTAKQWFMTIVIGSAFESAPTIKEVASVMGSSHQNVKQVALKLEQKDLLVMEKDKLDRRVLRLKLTDKSYKFLELIKQKATTFTQALFEEIDQEHMEKTRTVLERMINNLNKMD